MIASLLLAAAVAGGGEAPASFVVLAARADRSTEKELAGTVTELVLSSLAKGRGVHVRGEADVVPFLDAAAQKQLRACDDDAACLVEIGGALGTDYLVSVSLGALGRNYLVSARFLDAKQGQVAVRSSRSIPRSEDALADAICPLLQEMLSSLAAKDARVSAGPCLPIEAPKAAENKRIPTPLPLPEPPPIDEPPVARSVAKEWHFALRAGALPVAGLGLSGEISLGNVAVAIGTGTYLGGAGVFVHLLERRAGPYLGFTAIAIARGPLAAILNPLASDEAAPSFGGIGGNALVGWDLALGARFNARAAIGFAYNPQYWGRSDTPARYAPIAWELSFGPTF